MATVMGQSTARARRSAPKEDASPTSEEAAHCRALLKRKLGEIDQILQSLSPEDEASRKAPSSVTVVVGTSAMAAARPDLVREIATMINRAYGYQRVDRGDIRERLSMGDPGSRANRVLHIAFREGQPVGCMSSTFRVPWAEEGCGHWGLLVVDVEHQGQGIASTLVAAAEERLAGVCVQIQMEYEFTPGEAQSERLKAWYEGKCGFECVSGGYRGRGTQFRKCRKPISEEQQQRGRRQRVLGIRAEIEAELAELPDE